MLILLQSWQNTRTKLLLNFFKTDCQDQTKIQKNNLLTPTARERLGMQTHNRGQKKKDIFPGFPKHHNHRKDSPIPNYSFGIPLVNKITTQNMSGSICEVCVAVLSWVAVES